MTYSGGDDDDDGRSRQGGAPARAHRILAQVDNLDNRAHPDAQHSRKQAAAIEGLQKQRRDTSATPLSRTRAHGTVGSPHTRGHVGVVARAAHSPCKRRPTRGGGVLP